MPGRAEVCIPLVRQKYPREGIHGTKFLASMKLSEFRGRSLIPPMSRLLWRLGFNLPPGRSRQSRPHFNLDGRCAPCFPHLTGAPGVSHVVAKGRATTGTGDCEMAESGDGKKKAPPKKAPPDKAPSARAKAAP